MGHQIGCQQTALCISGGQIPGATMQANPQASGFERRQALRQQTGDHAAEHVSHTATGHTGIAVTTDQYLAASANQTTGALEYGNTTIALLQFTHRCITISLYYAAADAE